MMSYLNKHFEPVPILCAVDFCLESRPVNPIVYLVKKSESGIQKYLLYLFYLFRMCSMWQSGYLLVDDLRVLWCFCTWAMSECSPFFFWGNSGVISTNYDDTYLLNIETSLEMLICWNLFIISQVTNHAHRIQIFHLMSICAHSYTLIKVKLVKTSLEFDK